MTASGRALRSLQRDCRCRPRHGGGRRRRPLDARRARLRTRGQGRWRGVCWRRWIRGLRGRSGWRGRRRSGALRGCSRARRRGRCARSFGGPDRRANRYADACGNHGHQAGQHRSRRLPAGVIGRLHLFRSLVAVARVVATADRNGPSPTRSQPGRSHNLGVRRLGPQSCTPAGGARTASRDVRYAARPARTRRASSSASAGLENVSSAR